MIFTLHRYIFREVFKVFILAALALTLIISLGMILRPVQEYGVGPQQVFHLIGYFLPITLAFILPMAALFASSLVYGRFAGDNELDACRASGIGIASLIYPGLALAIMVAITNLILSFYVTPAFVQRAEKSLKADAQKIVFRNIQRQGYYNSPDNSWQVYADLVDLKYKMLSGVVITQFGKSGMEKIITCDNAFVKFDSNDLLNEVQITALKPYYVNCITKETSFLEKTSLTNEFPPLLGDNIKFKKIEEIKKIQSNYMRFNPIAQKAYEVYGQFIAELIAADIQRTITAGGDKFYRLHSGQKIIRFTADNCSAINEQRIELTGNINAEVSDSFTSASAPRTFRCPKAILFVEGQENILTITMVMYDTRWRTKDGAENLSGSFSVPGLVLPDKIVNITNNVTTNNLLQVISPASIISWLQKEPPALKALSNELQTKINKTAAAIEAETHSRLAFGIGCVPLVLIGLGLGIMKKGGHLLSAFGISSIPAGILTICIMSGRNIIQNPGTKQFIGIIIIWGGVLLLFLIAGIIYKLLTRN